MPDTIITRNFQTQNGAQNPPAAVIANPQVGQLGNLNNNVDRLTVVRRADVRDGHWELFLHEVGGAVTVKVDLMQAGYRVLYAAQIPAATPQNEISTEDINLTAPMTLGNLLTAVAAFAANRGAWTGTDDYNCQDFVIEFMMHLGLPNSQIFPYELRRVASKKYPSLITDTDQFGHLRQRY